MRVRMKPGASSETRTGAPVARISMSRFSLDVHHPLPGGPWDVEEQASCLHAGVVAEEVHPAECFERSVAQRFEIGGLAHIRPDCQRLRACGGELVHSAREGLLVDVGERDLHARLGTAPCQGEADPSGCTGDDRDPSIERPHSPPSPRIAAGQMPDLPGAMMPLGSRASFRTCSQRISA
jgi:hypothetical protein